MAITIDFNDFDLTKKYDADMTPIRFTLIKRIGVLDGVKREISISFALNRLGSISERKTYDALLPCINSLHVYCKPNGFSYIKGKGNYGTKSPYFKSEMLHLLDNPDLPDKNKTDLKNFLNTYIFFNKYVENQLTIGTKRQSDFLISKFKPYFDFGLPLNERIHSFLTLNEDKSLLADHLDELERAGLIVDTLPDGSKHHYGRGIFQKTLDPADMRSFVDSWNSICVPSKRIELINCPIINNSDKTVKSLLDLGNEFYDNLKIKDTKPIAIEEI